MTTVTPGRVLLTNEIQGWLHDRDVKGKTKFSGSDDPLTWVLLFHRKLAGPASSAYM